MSRTPEVEEIMRLFHRGSLRGSPEVYYLATEVERLEGHLTSITWWYESEKAHAKTVESELQKMKTMSCVEMMVENPNVCQHVAEWEARCLKAEAWVKELESYNAKLRAAGDELFRVYGGHEGYISESKPWIALKFALTETKY